MLKKEQLLTNCFFKQFFNIISLVPEEGLSVVPKFCNRRLCGYRQAAMHLSPTGLGARQSDMIFFVAEASQIFSLHSPNGFETLYAHRIPLWD